MNVKENKKEEKSTKYGIRERIRELGFTQAEIAEHLGIHRVSFSQMLVGNPTIGTLSRIADYMKIPLYQLFMPVGSTSPSKKEKIISTFVSSETGKRYKIVEINDGDVEKASMLLA